MSQFFQKTRIRLSETDPLYLTLFLALGLLVLLISFCGISYYYLNHYSMIPVMLFWGILLTRKPDPKAYPQLLLGFVVSLWFVISQSIQYASGMSVRSPGVFFLVYLLAFPFAGVARDEKEQTGLKMTGIAYITGALVLALYTALLALNALPGFLKPHIIWDGARLNPFWQSNICACILMIALGFCLYLFSCSTRKACKGLLLTIAALFLFLIALTNSRTGMLVSSYLVAGFVFFSIWKSGWKRFLLAGTAAVLIAVFLFACMQGLFAFHTECRIQAMLAGQNASGSSSASAQEDTPGNVAEDTVIVNGETGEAELNTYSVQGTLFDDMGTFNSRTLIWSSAIASIRNNPDVLFRGTDFPGNLIQPYIDIPVSHSHNSWLEVLMSLGLPGLISAVFFTAVAIWNIFAVLFFRNCALGEKVIALLLLCLLIAGIMEPYLFCGNLNFLYSDFAFFLCLGYLIQWKRT